MGKGRKTLVLVIAKLRKKYTLKALLNYTKLAKSTYYDALKKLSREDKYKGLKTLIHNICNKNHGRYGYRRVTMQLHKQGIKINHKVVMRLMKEENLTCKVRAKKYKSYRGQEGKIAKNILNRNFKAEKPNEKWATDVTEFALYNEKIYLSPIIDLYNGEIISYKISKRPILKQVLDMVEDATRKIKETKGIILHSDQGWQYQNKKYQKLLKEKESLETNTASVEALLDTVDNEELLQILLSTDKKTLQMVVMKMMGYAPKEISHHMELPEQTVYTRLRRLREKIKKSMKFE